MPPSPGALRSKDKRTNISPHQLHLPVGPTADQLDFVKVGELHLQLLQLLGRLLIYRADTLDTHVNHILLRKRTEKLQTLSQTGQQCEGGGHAAAPKVLPSHENTKNRASVGTYIG